MTEHPLLLSTPMVLAFIAGRKRVTRRIPTCANSLVDGRRVSGKKWKAYEFDIANYVLKDGVFWFFSGSTQRWYKITPIYQPGDKLWFRETWAPDGPVQMPGYPYQYKATLTGPDNYKWRPSIHMPKSACRLWADFSTVTCEHLSDITEEQAIDEGIEYTVSEMCRGYKDYMPLPKSILVSVLDNPIQSFQSLWESIHGPDSFAANPPVYAINFNPITRKP